MILPIAWWLLTAFGLAVWAAFLVKTRARAAGASPSPLHGQSALQSSELDPPMAEVTRLVPYIRAVLRARGVPRCEEQDLVQSVLLGAWLAITSGRYHPEPAGIRAWVAEIARRLAAKHRRSARFRRELLTDPDEIDEEHLAGDAEAAVIDEEHRELVIELLDPRDAKQTVLIAHDLDGVSMEEIARALHVTVSTAYRWRTAALEALQEQVRRRV